MAPSHIEASRPRRIRWGTGMVLVLATVLVGVFLPTAILFLSGTRHDAATAMTGGFMAAWISLIATLRVGRRRGWWC